MPTLVFSILPAMIIALSSLVAAAQTPLSLSQAVSMALEKNPLHKAALAETHISTAAVRQARSPLLAKITFYRECLARQRPGVRLRLPPAAAKFHSR